MCRSIVLNLGLGAALLAALVTIVPSASAADCNSVGAAHAHLVFCRDTDSIYCPATGTTIYVDRDTPLYQVQLRLCYLVVYPCLAAGGFGTGGAGLAVVGRFCQPQPDLDHPCLDIGCVERFDPEWEIDVATPVGEFGLNDPDVPGGNG